MVHPLSIFMQKKYSFTFNLSSSGGKHDGPPSINKERKKGVLWCKVHVRYTCWPCSWRHRHRLPEPNWQHSWPRLSDFQMLIFNKLDHTPTEKLLPSFLIPLLPFLLIEPVMLLCLGFSLSITSVLLHKLLDSAINCPRYCSKLVHCSLAGLSKQL